MTHVERRFKHLRKGNTLLRALLAFAAICCLAAVHGAGGEGLTEAT